MTLRHPAGLARRQQHRGAELAGVFGGRFDLVDLDVGQPQRARGAALDDPAAESSQVEGEVGAAPGLDQLPAPAQEVGVERARPCLITGVELQVDDGPGTGHVHGHLDCDPRWAGIHRRRGRIGQRDPGRQGVPAVGAAHTAANQA